MVISSFEYYLYETIVQMLYILLCCVNIGTNRRAHELLVVTDHQCPVNKKKIEGLTVQH